MTLKDALKRIEALEARVKELESPRPTYAVSPNAQVWINDLVDRSKHDRFGQ